MNKFEKISFEQFSKDIIEDKKVYQLYNIPKRATTCSAGYDFELIDKVVIEPDQTLKIPTGIKCLLEKDLVLFLIIRSSLGIKKNLSIVNQIGVIDSDYYNNISNEGHMWLFIKNNGKNTVILDKGSRIIQGIITKYYIVSEDEAGTERLGGMGTTDKEK